MSMPPPVPTVAYVTQKVEVIRGVLFAENSLGGVTSGGGLLG